MIEATYFGDSQALHVDGRLGDTPESACGNGIMCVRRAAVGCDRRWDIL